MTSLASPGPQRPRGMVRRGTSGVLANGSPGPRGQPGDRVGDDSDFGSQGNRAGQAVGYVALPVRDLDQVPDPALGSRCTDGYPRPQGDLRNPDRPVVLWHRRFGVVLIRDDINTRSCRQPPRTTTAGTTPPLRPGGPQGSCVQGRRERQGQRSLGAARLSQPTQLRVCARMPGSPAPVEPDHAQLARYRGTAMGPTSGTWHVRGRVSPLTAIKARRRPSRWSDWVAADAEHGGGGAQPFLVSQKMRSISAIWRRRSSATATSVVCLVSPAVFVAFQKRSCSSGYFSRCTGLK